MSVQNNKWIDKVMAINIDFRISIKSEGIEIMICIDRYRRIFITLKQNTNCAIIS